MSFLRYMSGLFMSTPTHCPNCGNGYFHWNREERGATIWKCSKCGHEIKD